MVAAYRVHMPVSETDSYLSAYPVGRFVPLPDAAGELHISRINSTEIIMDNPRDGFATVVLNISY